MKRTADIAAWAVLLLLGLRWLAGASLLSPPPIVVEVPTCVLFGEQSDGDSGVMQRLTVDLHALYPQQCRLLDDDLTLEQLANEAEWVRAAAALRTGETPFLVVANPRSGWSGPRPATVEATLEIARRHAQ